jgi:hypothetical protein
MDIIDKFLKSFQVIEDELIDSEHITHIRNNQYCGYCLNYTVIDTKYDGTNHRAVHDCSKHAKTFNGMHEGDCDSFLHNRNINDHEAWKQLQQRKKEYLLLLQFI